MHFGLTFKRGLPYFLIAGMTLWCGAVASATTLHPGDKISITVYNHPELSTPATTPTVLDASDRIWMPVAGTIDASNQTPEGLAHTVAYRLAPFVKKPAVDIQLVQQAQSVFVTGVSSGVYPYSPGETLLAVLSAVETSVPATSPSLSTVANPSAVAGHELQYGSIDLHRVVIERDGRRLPPVDAASLIATGQPAPALQPDDTVELTYKPIAVTVRGDVHQPGVAHLDPDQPLSDALYQVGGADDLTAADAFELTRGGSVVHVTKSSAQYRQPAQAGDVVYVPHGIHVGVVGSVTTPGRVLLNGDGSLLSALYYAGGPTKYGDIRHVKVLHDGKQSEYDITRLTHGGADANPQLADGDTLFVPEGHKIDFGQVFGAIIAASYLRFL